MDRLAIGVLGCSRFAMRAIIPAINELSDRFRLVGIASRRVEKAEHYAEVFHTQPFGGYESLLEESALKAVYIPLPNALHAEWIERALNRGLHVLVEKSLACSYEEAVCVHRMAREKKLVLVEDFHFRFHSQLAWILGMIRNGRLGAIRSIRASFGIPPLKDADDIRYRVSLGGGALLDVGAYPLKIAQILMGEDLAVQGAKLAKQSDHGVEVWGGAFVTQRSGDLFAELAFGFDHYYQCSLNLWGSKATLSTNRIFTCPNDVTPIVIIESDGSKEVLTLPSDNQIQNLLMHFRALTESSERAEPEYRQNLNQARLMDEVRERARES